MLGNKYRVVSHGCLTAIVDRLCRRQSFNDKALGVLTDVRQTVMGQIRSVCCVQAKTSSESRFPEIGKQCIEIAHGSAGGSGKLFDGCHDFAVCGHGQLLFRPAPDQPAIDRLDFSALTPLHVGAH